jgi:hypothetical protein
LLVVAGISLHVSQRQGRDGFDSGVSGGARPLDRF